MHPDCPPRDGFIRGQYESVEFIREIPKQSKKALSTTDLLKVVLPQDGTPSLEKESLLRHTERKSKESGEDLVNRDSQLKPATSDEVASEGRKRGKTISFAGSRGAGAKGEAMDDPDAHDDAEMNPVEWIMITRSDPGGSVPRFMVERGVRTFLRRSFLFGLNVEFQDIIRGQERLFAPGTDLATPISASSKHC